LIFDEVDVGISGGTAEIVGKLLRRLGETHQLLCITHLPQVAAQGHQHLLVEKRHEKNATFTQIRRLTPKEKISELARLLGGVEITKKTIDHAREMLEKV
jgi:DNA repair protein RecN (Recombination protein N)